METGKFLQRAALASAVAVPIVASGSVIARGDGDELVRCDGCNASCAPDQLSEGPLETKWCADCNARFAAFPWTGAERWDFVAEDDGEP
jgi:hypothetical protein